MTAKIVIRKMLTHFDLRSRLSVMIKCRLLLGSERSHNIILMIMFEIEISDEACGVEYRKILKSAFRHMNEHVFGFCLDS